MNKTILLLSLIPAVLWIFYFYRQDKYEKEPLKLLVITFILGCLSVIPAIFIELFLQNLIDYHLPFDPLRICIGMLMVGFTEEICKFFAVKMYVYKHEEFNEPMDGIVYCVTAALGFAFVENIGYMLTAKQAAGMTGAYTLGIMRAIFSMFGHATFGVVMGSYLGRAHFDKDNEGSLIFKGIFFASLVHALYNYTVTINKEGISAVLVLIAFLLVWRNLNRVIVDAAVDNSPFKPETETYRPKKWQWKVVNVITVLLISTVIGLAVYNFDKPKLYKNNKIPFKFTHHAFWKVYPGKNNKWVEVLGPKYKGAVPTVKIVLENYDSGMELDERAKKSVEQLKKERSSLEIITTDDFQLKGKDANRVIFKWKSKPKYGKEIPMLSHLLVTDAKGNTLIFLYETGEDSFDELKVKFDNILESFEMK